jgi:hypothetical protein
LLLYILIFQISNAINLSNLLPTVYTDLLYRFAYYLYSSKHLFDHNVKSAGKFLVLIICPPVTPLSREADAISFPDRTGAPLPPLRPYMAVPRPQIRALRRGTLLLFLVPLIYSGTNLSFFSSSSPRNKRPPDDPIHSSVQAATLGSRKGCVPATPNRAEAA